MSRELSRLIAPSVKGALEHVSSIQKDLEYVGYRDPADSTDPEEGGDVS
jgi:hypothetical protein